MQQSTSGAVRVASVKDVKPGSSFCAKAGDTALALFKTAAGYAAIDNLCPHAGGPLCEGSVVDDVVTCPWHGSQFDIETGEVKHGPAKVAVKTYPVEVRGDDLYVSLAADPAPASTGQAPKAVVFSFQPAFDAAHPFANKEFMDAVMAGIGFDFKLYGKLNMVPISQDGEEIDLHHGEVHVTEMDLKKMSDAMSAINAKFGTEITYCLFHSAQFPGAMLLNVRGVNAPSTLENAIRY